MLLLSRIGFEIDIYEIKMLVVLYLVCHGKWTGDDMQQNRKNLELSLRNTFAWNTLKFIYGA